MIKSSYHTTQNN